MRYITIIITTSNLPPRTFNMVYCGNCGRPLMKIRGEIAAMLNSMGVSIDEVPSGMGFFEHKCHSCKAMNRILLQ